MKPSDLLAIPRELRAMAILALCHEYLGTQFYDIYEILGYKDAESLEIMYRRERGRLGEFLPLFARATSSRSR